MTNTLTTTGFYADDMVWVTQHFLAMARGQSADRFAKDTDRATHIGRLTLRKQRDLCACRDSGA